MVVNPIRSLNWEFLLSIATSPYPLMNIVNKSIQSRQLWSCLKKTQLTYNQEYQVELDFVQTNICVQLLFVITFIGKILVE